MKIVSDKLKEALKKPTTQRKGKILVNGNYYEVYNVEYYADSYYEGNVIGNAIASQLDFDMPFIDKFDSFEYLDGVWTGEEYEYVNMGTFTVFDEKDEDEFNKHITSFDNLIKFNAPFEDKQDYPKTLFEELQNVCQQAGVELENKSITNGNFIIENNQFVNNETLKMVLKNICGISGTYGIIKNDKLVLQLKNETNEIINKSHHEPIEWKRKTYGINQLILGMSQVEGEYVLREDLKDIEKNGVHKLVINDNYFAYTQDKRQELIDELFNQVKGFGYIPYEMNGEWLNYVDIGDTINIDGNDTIILRINGKSPKSLESTISAPAIIDSSIEYVNNTNAIENRIKRTEIKVDKYDQKINLAVETAQEAYDKVEVYNPVLEAEGNGQLSLPDCAGEKLLEFTVDGKSEQKKYTGKNIFDYVTTLKASTGGLTNTLNPDGSITTTGILSTNYISICQNQDITNILEDGQVYTAWQENINGGSNLRLIVYINNKETNTTASYVIIEGVNSKSFTVDKAKYFYTISIQTDTTTNWGTTSRTFTNKYMLVKGTDVTFEPYVGRKASPNPNYPSEIKSISGVENLFSIDDTTTHTKIIDGEVTITTASYDPTKFLIKVSKNQPYTLSFINDNASSTYPIRLQVKESDSSGNAGTKIADDTISYTSKHVRTITPTTEYIIIEMFRGVATNELTTISEIQLEKGTIAHHCVSFGSNYLIEKATNENSEETISLIDLKGNKLCSNKDLTVKDILTVKNGKANIDKKINEIILNDNYEWAIGTSNGLNFFQTQVAIDDFNFINDNTCNYICTHFETIKPTERWKDNTLYINGAKNIVITSNNFKTVDEFKTWLSNNQITLQYELATQQIIDLGEVSIETVQSDCTLELEEELETDMYAKYIKNNPYNEAYSTRLDTKAQIQLSENKIESSVSETILQNTELMQGEIDSLSSNLENNYMTSEEVQNLNNLTNESLAVITNEFKQIQTSTQTQFQAITNILQNGVNLVKTTYTTIDDEGIKIAKSTDSFNSTFDNRGLKLYSYTDLMAVYTNKGAGVTNLLVTGTMDLGYSKIMKVTQNGKKYTGIFYSDAMVQTLEDFVED